MDRSKPIVTILVRETHDVVLDVMRPDTSITATKKQEGRRRAAADAFCYDAGMRAIFRASGIVVTSFILCANSMGCAGRATSLDGPSEPPLDVAGDATSTPDAANDTAPLPDAPADQANVPDGSPLDAGTCIELGKTCVPGVACCSGSTCNQPGNLCGMPPPSCPDFGAPCTSKADCCLALHCSPQGFCYTGDEACQHQNGACSQSADCCTAEGLQCLGGTCQPGPSCLPNHASCDPSTPPCCDPYVCLPSGQCGEPATCPSTGDPCGDCLAQHCCNEYVACESNPTCQNAIACALNCTSSWCIQQCLHDNSSPEGNALLGCGYSSCYAACM